MLSRRLISMDPSTMRRLQNEFVPYAGDDMYLRHPGPDHDWFDPIVKKINPFYPTYQCYYVVGADGTPYAYSKGQLLNPTTTTEHWDRMVDPVRMTEVLDAGLVAFRARPARHVALPSPAPGAKRL